MSGARMEMVKKAYEKLDVNKDGCVRLDDIAKIYDASCHPDVVSGKKDEGDLVNFQEFVNTLKVSKIK